MRLMLSLWICWNESRFGQCVRRRIDRLWFVHGGGELGDKDAEEGRGGDRSMVVAAVTVGVFCGSDNGTTRRMAEKR
jgi:hypothetical protein